MSLKPKPKQGLGPCSPLYESGALPDELYRRCKPPPRIGLGILPYQGSVIPLTLWRRLSVLGPQLFLGREDSTHCRARCSRCQTLWGTHANRPYGPLSGMQDLNLRHTRPRCGCYQTTLMPVGQRVPRLNVGPLAVFVCRTDLGSSVTLCCYSSRDGWIRTSAHSLPKRGC